MYSYFVVFKDGKTQFITNHKIEGESVWLYDYTRKGTKYPLNEVSKIVESEMYMGTKTEKVLFEVA